MQLHWAVLIHKFSGFLGLKKSEVPVFLAPSVHHLRQTRSDILTIFCFVLTIRAKNSCCSCVFGVLGEWGNTGAPCSQPPVTGAAWHCQKTSNSPPEKEHHHGQTCVPVHLWLCSKGNGWCGKPELHHILGWLATDCLGLVYHQLKAQGSGGV